MKSMVIKLIRLSYKGLLILKVIEIENLGNLLRQ